MNNLDKTLDNIGADLCTIKHLAIIIEKLYLYMYDSDFEECDKRTMLYILIKEIKEVNENFQQLLLECSTTTCHINPNILK